MTEKAYIVANKQQELEVLNKFEQNGLVWLPGDNPTDWLPSESASFENFPYMLIEKGYITWSSILRTKDETVVYDGRNEENKYKVTQKFMNALNKWRDNEHIKPTSDKVNSYVSQTNLINLPAVVENWWVWGSKNPLENNNRLIAIIQWLNGEDMFEVEKPHKFVVRSENTDVNGDYNYVKVVFKNLALVTDYDHAMKFDTREEAQEWANSHQVVVEIDEEGNEVEL